MLPIVVRLLLIIKTRPPTTIEAVLHEYLLYNQYIMIGGCSLAIAIMNSEQQYLKARILDIIYNDGNLLKYEVNLHSVCWASEGN